VAKSNKDKWKKAVAEVLIKTDIKSVYERLGAKFSNSKAGTNGWMACHAIGREDRNPSARINVGDGPARGRYQDFGDDGKSISLFDAMAKFGPAPDWKKARDYFAKEAGVKLPKGDQELVEDKFSFYDLTPGVTLIWCKKKKPITPAAIAQAGGTAADWPKGVPPEIAQHLITFSMYGEGLMSMAPTGRHCVDQGAGKIRKYQGKNSEPQLLKTMTVGTPGLMNEWALRHLEKAEVVWVVEGLTDMLAMQSTLGERTDHVVVTSGACTYHPRAEWVRYFAGKDIRVCFDNDEPGRAGADAWIGALRSIAASVRRVVLPEEINDLRDWFNQDSSHDYEALWEYAETFEPVKLEEEVESKPHEMVLKVLGIIVIGQIEGTDHIEIFSTRLHKKTLIKDIDRFSYAKMMLALGGEVVEKYVTEAKDPPAVMFKVEVVRNAIAREAGKRFLSARSAVGSGAWPVGKEMVLIAPRSADIWNGRELTELKRPAYNEQRLDFGGDPWYDRARLERFLQASRDKNWCIDVVAEATSLFRRWETWERDTSPELLAGLFLCTWVQTAWEFRPQVAVIGPSNCGKTTLFQETLAPMFGSISKYICKPTEPGLRQTIGNTGKIVFIDEFEHDHNRAKVLDLIRTSSRGADIPRGTPGQKAKECGLRHIVWVSGIELNLDRAANKNRFIFLNMKNMPKGKPATLKVPDRDKLANLGQRMLAVALRHWRRATALAVDLKTRDFGINHRIVELFGAPVAMLACSQHHSAADTEMFMREALKDQDADEQEERDEVTLLRAIYEAPVRLPGGRTATVSMILDATSDFDLQAEGKAALLVNGIKIVRAKREGEYGRELLFVSNKISGVLLKGTQFEGFDTSQILVRIDRARRSRQRMGGHSGRGVSIPMEEVEKLIGAECANWQSMVDDEF